MAARYILWTDKIEFPVLKSMHSEFKMVTIALLESKIVTFPISGQNKAYFMGNLIRNSKWLPYFFLKIAGLYS